MRDGPIGHLTRGSYEPGSGLDTSTLGPIRCDPARDVERARVVREALWLLVEDLGDRAAGNYLAAFLNETDEETLLRLAALLKS